jgi:hypothetical protein
MRPISSASTPVPEVRDIGTRSVATFVVLPFSDALAVACKGDASFLEGRGRFPGRLIARPLRYLCRLRFGSYRGRAVAVPWGPTKSRR